MIPFAIPPARVRLLVFAFVLALAAVPPAAAETLGEIAARVGVERDAAFAASPHLDLARDWFSRFTRDPDAKPGSDEVAIGDDWTIRVPDDAAPLARPMADRLADFLSRRMGVAPRVVVEPRGKVATPYQRSIALLDSGGGEAGLAESFTIDVLGDGAVRVAGADAAGLRDGIVRLADAIGFREAPFLRVGSETFRPRLRVRLGAVPYGGTPADLAFYGFNALVAGGGNLHSLSTSDAIPELASRRAPGALEAGAKAVAEARKFGLRAYAWLDTRQKYPKDDPVFAAHPEIRGALTWSADGEYVLCTEHPLVRRFLKESVEGLFRAEPAPDGIVVIIGGEGFYHCFMRPHGVEKGHTNCARCEALGPETVVANLVNGLAEAARGVNPDAEVAIWPYSAEHVWSIDKAQSPLIAKLGPGVALLTEIEKDEYVSKEGGVRKHLWDYSIDLIGPGERAAKQIAECSKRGVPVFLKSEPELSFEAPRLANVPCMDRWAERAEALASCGADGAFVFPAFRPCYGTIAAEVGKHLWWERVGEGGAAAKPDADAELDRLARRLAGDGGAPHVRRAWKLASEAVGHSPELPPYYTGPYYLGPAHPMCVDRDAALPEVFDGYYLFMAEMTDAEGLKKRPTYFRDARGDVPAFLNLYRKMETALRGAAEAMDAARPSVEERRRAAFDAEDASVQWFYRTARTHANFYESCAIRDRLRALAAKESRTEAEAAEAREQLGRWLEVLADERENARAALPIMESDPRIDFRFGGDHTFEHGADVLRAKLEILEREIAETAPALAARCGASGD